MNDAKISLPTIKKKRKLLITRLFFEYVVFLQHLLLLSNKQRFRYLFLMF